MNVQIGEVLATYWRRALSGPLTGLLALIPLAGLVVAVLVEAKQIPLIICLWLFGPALVADHFRQQIIHISQRRLPNAIAAHTVVAVGLLLLFGVGVPAAQMAVGVWSWGALGFVFALAVAVFALSALGARGFPAVFFPFLSLACFVNLAPKWLQELWQGRHEALGLPLLAAGICGISATLARLVQMAKRDAGHFGPLDLVGYERSMPGMGDAQVQARLWRPLGWMLTHLWERQLRLWPTWGKGPLWQRVRLWSTPHALPLQLLMGGLMYLWVVVFGAIIPSFWQSNFVNGAGFMIIIFPVANAGSMLKQRRETAAVESLRPAGRSQFLMETGLAFAWRLAVMWGFNSLAWCALAYLLGSADWRKMLGVVLLTAALNVLFFAVTVWAMRFIRLGVWVVMVGLFTLFAAWGPMLWSTGIASFGSLLWVVPGMLVAAALITWDAYRRWMQTELA